MHSLGRECVFSRPHLKRALADPIPECLPDMSDSIKHECGIALLRLKQPLHYYTEKYGTSFYGLNKMYLLMEKEHNRGQDGAGLANIKLDVEPGKKYISRIRSNDQQPIRDVFARVMSRFAELEKTNPDKLKDPYYLKRNFAFTGELFLGHLRYGTYEVYIYYCVFSTSIV